MSRATLATIVVLIALTGTGAVQGASSGVTKLTIVDRTPLTLRGTGFAAGERVRLVVRTTSTRQLRLSATRSGSFLAAFRATSYNRCSGLNAFAFGSRGSRAQLVLPAPACPPTR
ncbi:MAG: hypothetical protein ACRDNH_06060 [Gaiellaceae bacterium]